MGGLSSVCSTGSGGSSSRSSTGSVGERSESFERLCQRTSLSSKTEARRVLLAALGRHVDNEGLLSSVVKLMVDSTKNNNVVEFEEVDLTAFQWRFLARFLKNPKCKVRRMVFDHCTMLDDCDEEWIKFGDLIQRVPDTTHVSDAEAPVSDSSAVELDSTSSPLLSMDHLSRLRVLCFLHGHTLQGSVISQKMLCVLSKSEVIQNYLETIKFSECEIFEMNNTSIITDGIPVFQDLTRITNLRSLKIEKDRSLFMRVKYEHNGPTDHPGYLGLSFEERNEDPLAQRHRAWKRQFARDFADMLSEQTKLVRLSIPIPNAWFHTLWVPKIVYRRTVTKIVEEEMDDEKEEGDTEEHKDEDYHIDPKHGIVIGMDQNGNQYRSAASDAVESADLTSATRTIVPMEQHTNDDDSDSDDEKKEPVSSKEGSEKMKPRIKTKQQKRTMKKKTVEKELEIKQYAMECDWKVDREMFLDVIMQGLCEHFAKQIQEYVDLIVGAMEDTSPSEADERKGKQMLSDSTTSTNPSLLRLLDRKTIELLLSFVFDFNYDTYHSNMRFECTLCAATMTNAMNPWMDPLEEQFKRPLIHYWDARSIFLPFCMEVLLKKRVGFYQLHLNVDSRFMNPLIWIWFGLIPILYQSCSVVYLELKVLITYNLCITKKKDEKQQQSYLMNFSDDLEWLFDQQKNDVNFLINDYFQCEQSGFCFADYPRCFHGLMNWINDGSKKDYNYDDSSSLSGRRFNKIADLFHGKMIQSFQSEDDKKSRQHQRENPNNHNNNNGEMYSSDLNEMLLLIEYLCNIKAKEHLEQAKERGLQYVYTYDVSTKYTTQPVYSILNKLDSFTVSCHRKTHSLLMDERKDSLDLSIEER